MSITLHNRKRYSQTFELTMACAHAGMPGITMQVVTGLPHPTGRYQGMTPQGGDTVIRGERTFPPSLTIRAREKLQGLPNAVGEAPEIVAAVKAGLLTLTKESTNSSPAPRITRKAHVKEG